MVGQTALNYFDFHTHNTGPEPGVTALISSPTVRPGRFSLELHPWSLPPEYTGISAAWRRALPLAAAVGEIGLDRLRGPELSVQAACFHEALALAAAAELPVVIHAVRATGPVLKAVAAYPRMRKMLHGFRGSGRKLEPFLEAGFLISCVEVPPPELPLDRLGLESDEHPERLLELYDRTAAARGLTLTALQQAMAANFQRFLGVEVL